MTNIFTAVVKMSMTASAVILVVIVLRALLSRAPKKYSYFLWAAALFRLLCPVSVSSVFSLFNLPVMGTQEQELTQIQAVTVLPAVPAVPGSDAGIPPEYTSSVTQPTATALNWDDILVYVWILGVVVVLLVFCIQILRLHHKIRFAVRVEGNVWECDEIPGPFVLGLSRPRIFLPVWLKGGQREHVLAHERFHIRRFDHWVKVLCLGVRAIHWFNPLVWLMIWLLDRDMELSCDEGALKELGQENREEYSRTLLSLAANRREFGPVLAFGTPAVKRRIVNALRYRKAAKVTVVLALVVLLVAGLTCCTNAKQDEENNVYADALYQAKVTYAGDNSAVSKLIGVMMEENQLQFDTMELHTAAEPYGLTLNLFLPEGWNYDLGDHFAVDKKAFSMSVLLLTLIDNLSYCQQNYDLLEEGERIDYAQLFPRMTVAQAEQVLGISDLKSYGTSPEKIAELLELIGQVDVQQAKYSQIVFNDRLTDEKVEYRYDGEGSILLTLYRDGTHVLYVQYPENGTQYLGTWTREEELIALQLAGSQVYTVFFSEGEDGNLYYQKNLSPMDGIDFHDILPQGACLSLVSQGDTPQEGLSEFILYDMVDPELDEVTIFAPQVALYENGESAIFRADNGAIGHYTEENGILTLTDEMNDRVYRFRRIDAITIEYMADGSDEIVMVVENDYLTAPVVDGTRFVVGESSTIQVGTAVIDTQVERYQLVVEMQSTGQFLPALRLYSDGTYVFNHSILSSRFHTGTWTEENDVLTLSGHQACFRFRRVDEYTLQFLEEGSYGYDQYPQHEIVFGDGALFRRSEEGAYYNWPDLVLVSHGGRYRIQGLDADVIEAYPTQNGTAGDIYFVNPVFLGGYFEGKAVEGGASWTDESKTSIHVGFTQSSGTSEGTLTGPSLDFELDLVTGELTHITFVSHEANGENVTLTGHEMKEMGYMLASLLQMVENTAE